MMQNIYLNGMIKKETRAMPLNFDFCSLCYEEIRATPLYYRVTSVNSVILVRGVALIS